MKNTRKITSILIIASMTMVLAAGCASKTSTTTTNTTTNTANSQTRKFDPAVMKTLYSNTLKDLVAAGTITQDQSDKVLAEVTKNVPKGTGTVKPAGATKPTSTDRTSGTGKPTDTRSKNNRLSALVTSGVITQAQADTINTKISDAMKSNQTK